MPVIGAKIYKQIDLVTEGAWVKVLTNPKSGVWKEIQDEPDQEKAGAIMFSKLIVEWNFCDEAGTTSPITPENVKLALSDFDIARISTELGMSSLVISDAKKKPSTLTSFPAEQSQPPLSSSASNTESASE